MQRVTRFDADYPLPEPEGKAQWCLSEETLDSHNARHSSPIQHEWRQWLLKQPYTISDIIRVKDENSHNRTIGTPNPNRL